MRKLFLLQGAPGSGKTSFLREHDLTEHAVGFDMVRELLSGPHPTLDDGVEGATRRIGGDVTKLAIEFAEKAVRMRCARGETVFVDTVCASSKDVQRWEKIARDFDYEVILVDVQGSVADDELLARNASRLAVDRMGDEVVLRHAARVRASRDSGAVAARTITPDEVEAELVVATRDFRHLDRVLVVGDVQGCGTALDALIEKVNPGRSDAVVFVGDLFDRGVENDRVYRTVADLERRTAVHKVSGNHCRHLIECIKHTAPGRYAKTRESIRQMVEAGILAGDLLDLYQSMVPFITARFADDAELWITHGGVVGLDAHRVDESPELPMGGYRTGLMPDRFFEYGSSRQDAVHADKGDYSTEIDEVFAERYAGQGILAFHGHRATTPFSGGGISFGLESSVEFDGGVLTAALIKRDPGGATRVDLVEVPNPVTCGPKEDRPSEQRKRAKATGRELLEQLRGSDLVREKVIEDDLSSFNFTRDAFYQQEWNDLTITARGLFLNTDTGSVAGRGYAKFFNVGERPETALTAVLARFGDGGLVKVEHKLNGFLGLAFVHNGQLRTFSKSGPSAFADEFGRLLAEHLGDRLAEFTAALEKSGVTLTFEALSPADPHIVDDGSGVVLLHAVARTTERTLLLDEVGDRFGDQFGFRRPATTVVSGPDALREAIDAAARSDTEGAVLRHLPTGQMVKVKSDSYAAWKALRATLTRLATGKLDLADLRSSRVPRFAAAVTVADRLRNQGLTLSELMIGAVHSPALDLPRVRALVGDLPEVLNLSTTVEREAA